MEKKERDFARQYVDKVVNRLGTLVNQQVVKIKYHKEQYPSLEECEVHGNFIDLRAATSYTIHQGEFVLIDLGVSMKIPEGFWGQLVPRSSLFKNTGLIQTNSFGVIDTEYCGENDHWMLPVYATRDCVVETNMRIAQFRIVPVVPFDLVTVDHMEDKDRGGFGSTGK